MATIRKRPSGNYEVQIRLSGLKPIVKTFPTKTLARQFQREVEGNIKLQQALGKPIIESITFLEVSDLYMEQYTKKDARNMVSRLGWWCKKLGGCPITEITQLQVDDHLITLAENVTGSTCRRYKSTISAIFEYFIQHPKYKRLQISNPVKGEAVSSFSENPAKERFLSDKEQSKLLDACKTSKWKKLYLLVLMAVTTGARRGELLGLKWSDIDFSQRLARLHTSKNGKPRLLPLTVPVINELTKFREIGNGLIFKNTVVKQNPDDIEKPFEIRKSYKKALEDAGIENCRFHDLRHTAASNLAKNGASLLEIAEVLGHSNTTITKRYAHLCTEHKASLIDRVMGDLGSAT